MTSGATDMIGIVLAGGKSLRMGEDKGGIPWHGIAQRDHVAGMLSRICEQTFISCRDEQQFEKNDWPLLPDAHAGIGPLGAILTALGKFPGKSLLVVACDLPLLDEATLAQLVNERDPSAIATTYISPHDGLPEPLITIWEPAAYPYLLQTMEQGYKCPRKALIRAERVKLIEPLDPKTLMNANTPEDAALVRELIHNTPGR